MRGYDWKAVVYDLATFDTVTVFDVSPDKGLGFGVDLEFSPDNQFLVVGEDNRSSTVYSTKTWKEVVKVKPENGSCGGCATLVKVTPDSKNLLKVNRMSGVELLSLSKCANVSVYIKMK